MGVGDRGVDCLRMGEKSPRKKNQPPLKEMAKIFYK